MAQFDVYRPPATNRVAYLMFLVDIQSDLWSALETRQVAPLVDPKRTRATAVGALTPSFDILGQEALLYPHQMFAVPRSVLIQPIASLADQRDRIVRAIDALLAGV